ncbi:hypothetical protein [Halonatronum saccharophilum]|uniref:hypothetical protein n=1 Tax=Halonatronum saccharophilum TaxID=150060 RepID=UPI000482D1C6|nr:hypothetical protein [Halonatronum saccharophilum]
MSYIIIIFITGFFLSIISYILVKKFVLELYKVFYNVRRRSNYKRDEEFSKRMESSYIRLFKC